MAAEKVREDAKESGLAAVQGELSVLNTANELLKEEKKAVLLLLQASEAEKWNLNARVQGQVCKFADWKEKFDSLSQASLQHLMM